MAEEEYKSVLIVNDSAGEIQPSLESQTCLNATLQRDIRPALSGFEGAAFNCSSPVSSELFNIAENFELYPI